MAQVQTVSVGRGNTAFQTFQQERGSFGKAFFGAIFSHGKTPGVYR
jgi:hypothetical protein